MNKSKISLIVVFSFQLIAILLAVFRILPREAILISTGITVFYFIFSPLEDGLFLFIISIPVFAAMSITEEFDTMANWRILLAILFLIWFFRRKWPLLKKDLLSRPCCPLKFKIRSNLIKWTFIFLGIGALSVFIAENPIAAIKKLLFLLNIFLLFVIVKDLAKQEEERKKIIRAAIFSLSIILLFGYLQLISVFWVPFYSFWQWWAENVISVFYGANLSQTLKISNTWFSYYPDKLPTLRMFSLFPDSHSFALFALIGLIFLVYALKTDYKIRKNLIWALIGLCIFALMFSGSRGIWLAGILPFFAILFFYVFRDKKTLRPFFIILVIFAISFPFSSLILSLSRGGGDATLAFQRAKSITDMEEISVKSRLGIWKSSFSSILKHPLLGVGIGNYPLVLGEDISAAKRGASAHNLYLDIVSETGIIGLFAFIFILILIFKKALKSAKSNEYYAISFLFFFVWILFYNLFDVVLFNDKVLLFFMVTLGVLYRDE